MFSSLTDKALRVPMERIAEIRSDDPDHVTTAETEHLTDALHRLNPDGDTFTSRGKNIGWRNRSGVTTVTISDGIDLIQKIAPNSTRWRLVAYGDEHAIELKLFHHDSPNGETHRLTPEADPDSEPESRSIRP